MGRPVNEQTASTLPFPKDVDARSVKVMNSPLEIVATTRLGPKR